MLHSHFFVFVLFFFLPLGWVIFSLSVDLGGPPQCLNSGPGSEPGVNRGLGSLFWGYASNVSYFPFLFSLCFRPVPRLKDTHCQGLGWVIFSLSVDLGGPPQCLNSGPGSEPGVNRGLGSLFWGYASNVTYLMYLIASRIRIAKGNIFSGDIPLRSITQGAPPFVGPLPPPDLVASRPGLADLALLRFYDPSHFRAGNIHGKSYVWQNLISNSSCGEVDLLEIIREGVRVEHFFRPFRGNFKGKAYDSDIPPPLVNRELNIRRLRTTATDKYATAHDQNHVTVHFSRVVLRLR